MVNSEEAETKYRLDSAAAHERLRARLQALGARQVGRERERNVLFDQADGALRRADRVLRLRELDGGPGGRLTFKGPAAFDGGVKRRVELEVAVSDCAVTRALLEALGYAPGLEYPKDRETWHLDGVEVALDLLPFGVYCEVEGPAEAVPALAERLGLTRDQVEPAGYPTLMARHLQDGGAPRP